MTKCYEHEECEYNGQPECHLPDGMKCPHGVKADKPTNADRIRAMSDEELAVFLDGFTCNCIDCRDNDGKNESCPIYNRQRCRYCEPKDIMDWLQSPTKEDT